MKKIVFLIVLMLFSKSCYTEANEARVEAEEPNYFYFLSQLTLPDKLELCGERIPLEIPEVRERAEREFYLLLQQPGQIILYLKRSGKFFPMFERIIKENNLPDDIKYLSVAESALYQARSPKDAVGLWQFIEGTARTYGLRVDKDVDERRHPEKSTQAAMKYLERAYRRFGSWIVAFASYNMGVEGVANNINFQGTDNYFELFLNEETSRYIFRIAIIKEIMQYPEKYGFRVPVWERYKPERTKIIKETSSIPNLAEWAKANRTTYKDVKILNPWILGRSLPAPKPGEVWLIRIPEK